MKSSMRLDYLRVALTLMVAGTSLHAYAQPNEPIFSLAKKEKPALLESLETLFSIEIGRRPRQTRRSYRRTIEGSRRQS